MFTYSKAFSTFVVFRAIVGCQKRPSFVSQIFGCQSDRLSSKRSSVGEMIGFLSDCRLSSVVGETISVRRSVVTSPAAQEACFNNSPRGESQHLKSEKNVTSL